MKLSMSQPRRQNPTVQIPQERLLQLKELAEALGGTTMSATLGKLFELARSEGLITSGIPGIDINVLSDGIVLCFDDTHRVPLTFGQAEELTAILSTSAAEQRPETAAGRTPLPVQVTRKGNGVVLSADDHSTPLKILSKDLALEFADVLAGQLQGNRTSDD